MEKRFSSIRSKLNSNHIIYLNNNSILKKYLNLFIQKKDIHSNYYYERLNSLITTDDYIHIFNNIFNFIIENYKYYYDSCLNNTIDILISKNIINNDIYTRVDLWLKQYIKINASNENTIVCLFSIIDESELEYCNKIQYIKEFLLNNDSLDLFTKIPLFPGFLSYTNSIIPICDERIRYINELLDFFNGTKWLDHKLYIENFINGINQFKEHEQVNELLGGNFRSIN